MAATNEKIKFELTASDQTSQAFNAILGRLDQVDQSAKRSAASIGSLASSIRGVAGGLSIGYLAKQFSDLTNEFTSVSARLKNVTGSTYDFTNAQKQLFEIAQSNRISFSQTSDLFSSLSRATSNLNIPQEKMLKLTDGIGKALVVSGANSQSASAALIQLSQGFSAGALRGQEFMSVQEQAPEILRAVAHGLNITQGELKKLAEEGKLTTSVFIDAFLKGLPKIESQFSQMPVTIGGALERVNNAILITVGNLDKLLGTSPAIAKWISDFASGIEKIFPTVDTLNETKKLADYASVVIDLDRKLKSLEARPKGVQSFLGIDVEAQISETRAQLEIAKRQFTSVMQNQQYDAIRTGARRFFEPSPTEKPGLTKEQEKALKDQAKFAQDLNDKLIEITQGERALFIEQAKRLKFAPKAIDELLVKYDKLEAKKESDKAEKKTEKESKQQLDAAEKSLNYLDKYRQDMDIITEQIALKNDGIYRTAEQQLMENARLQLTKKYNEEIVKIKNLDNLTEQGKLNAIAAANIKYQEQLDLVGQISAQREADQKDLVKGISTGAGKYFEEISNIAAFTENATTRALQGMEDAFVSMAMTGKLSFKDLANSIISDLIRIQIRQSIVGPLANAMSSWLSPSFSPITSGSSSLSATSADIMGRRAMGGPVTGGKSYLVGENGPEIFTPGASGGITSNSNLGGGVSVNIVNNSGSQASAKETVDSRGNRRIDVTIGELVAGEISRAGSSANRAIRSTFGASPMLAGR